MSFNALRFLRSQYLRDTTGVAVPSDAYWSYVIALVRTNPDYTGTSSYYARRNLAFNSMGDSDSPTAATLGGYSASYYHLSPNSPYKTYPSTDSIYTLSMDAYQLYSSINQYSKTNSSTTGPGYPAAPGSDLEQTYNYISANQSQMVMDSALDIGVAIKGGFTLECWVYVPTTGISTLSGFLLGAQHSVFLFVNSDRTVTAEYSPFYNVYNQFSPGGSSKAGSYPDTYNTIANSVKLWSYTSSATLTAGSWNHVAITCSYTPQMGTNTGSTNLFINGTRVGQQLNPTVSTGFTGVRTPLNSLNTKPNAIIIGSRLETTGIRFIAGNCLSVNSFTSPTSKVSSNVIGWNGSSSTFTNTACFVTHFTTNGKQLPLIDYSPYRHYVTASNTTYPVQQASNLPSVSNPTTNLQSMYFNGSTSPSIALIQNPQQQLLNTTNSVLGLLSGQNFTVNFFFYRTAQSADYIFDHGIMRLYVNNGNQLSLRISSTTDRILLAAGSASLSTWYYVQFSRTNNGGTSRTYKLTAISSSGTVYTGTDYTATTVTDQSYSATASQLFIGSDAANTSSNILNGYMVDYRVSGGIVRPTPTSFPNFHPTVAPG
jgi:hypothetical protein